MKLSIIVFTDQGYETARQLQEQMDLEDVLLVRKHHGDRDLNLHQWSQQQMEEKRALLFVGACGIAVRSIAPCLKDKTVDSPVLVMDEKAQFIIPILSGHLGGANELSRKIGQIMGALPVITTATDLNQTFAIDLFAKQNRLQILNKEGIVQVSAKLLKGEPITLWSECPVEEIPTYFQNQIELVTGTVTKQTDVVISTRKQDLKWGVMKLYPKQFIMGIGCKKGKREEEMEAFLLRQLEEQNLCIQDIAALASIDMKAMEPGILEFAKKFQLPFYTYSADELMQVPGVFTESAFVQKQVGVDCVCERAAKRASGKEGTLILNKKAENGMTLAIAKCNNKLVWKRREYEEA